MMLDRQRRRTGLRAVALSIASVAVTPAAWAVGRLLALPRASASGRTVGSLSRASRARHATPAKRPADVGRALGARPAPVDEDLQCPGVPTVVLAGLAGRTTTGRDAGGTIGAPLGAQGGVPVVSSLFDALRRERPVVVYDLTKPREPRELRGKRARGSAVRESREAYVRAVEEILVEATERYGRAVDVVSSDLACEIVASAVSRNPGLVRSVVMLAPGGFDAQSPVARLFAKGTRELARRVLDVPLLGAAVERGVARVARDSQADRSPQNGYFTCSFHEPDLTKTLARLTCIADREASGAEIYDALSVPVLMLYGFGRPVSPAAIAAMSALAARAPSCRCADVDGLIPCAAAIVAFQRSLTPKPKLRLLQGERVGRPAEPRGHLHLAARPA